MKTAVKAGYMVASQVHETVAERPNMFIGVVAEARGEQKGGATVQLNRRT